MSRRRSYDDLEDIADTNEFDDKHDITKPIDLMEAAPDAAVTKAEAIHLWDRIDRIKRDLHRSKRITADRILKALGRKPPSDRLNSLDFKMKIVWGMLVIALGSAGASITQIFGYVGDHREMSVLVKRLTDTAAEQSTRIRALEETNARSVQRLDDLIQRINNK